MEFLTIDEFAAEIELPRTRVLNRVIRKKIKAEKRGWMWMIPRDEVTRVKKELENGPRDFYVYFHKMSNGKIFWVGKSRTNRVDDFQPGRHSPEYDKVLAQHGSENLTAEIIKMNLTNHEAELTERNLIRELRTSGHPITNVLPLK